LNQKLFPKLFFELIILLFFASCSSNQPKIPLTEYDSPEGLLETATGVSLNFSDLGKSKLLLNTPKLIKSDNKDNQMIMECPIGMELIFYDSLKNIESVLIADYGKLFSKKQLLKVRENVQFYNYKNDTLFAEELIIDFAKDSIFSEKLVTFSNKEGRITGEKLKANSNFTYFEMSDISQSHVNYDL
jgi:LPS export ABC transporter protein LptC